MEIFILSQIGYHQIVKANFPVSSQGKLMNLKLLRAFIDKVICMDMRGKYQNFNSLNLSADTSFLGGCEKNFGPLFSSVLLWRGTAPSAMPICIFWFSWKFNSQEFGKQASVIQFSPTLPLYELYESLQ